MTYIKHHWKKSEIEALFALAFNDLLFKAHRVHREFFNANKIQRSALLSVKTGACPEDCSYCAQSARYDTQLKRETLMPLAEVITQAKSAKKSGATRFCMGAAWRNPTDKNLDKVIVMIKAVKALDMETCVTLGMLSNKQARKLKTAGLDYYNHNIDTSKEYYNQVITTRSFEDRIKTLQALRTAGIRVCSGAILGMGETRADRISMLKSLANLEEHPESVPINALIPIDGTPLADAKPISDIEFVRVIAVARIMMPRSVIRLSAGRLNMTSAMQALCFFAGANSLFYGEQLLTTGNAPVDSDARLFNELGIQ